MRDFYLVVDKTGSMQRPYKSGSSTSRWKAAHETVLSLAYRLHELDKDGFDFFLFSESTQHFPNATPELVDQIFKDNAPSGGTYFMQMLDKVIPLTKKSGKPAIVAIVTDGEPMEESEKKQIAKKLIEISNKLEDDSELGIVFLQIGDDAQAGAFLKKLDDDLQAAGAKFDIVDVKTFAEVDALGIDKILLDAVND